MSVPAKAASTAFASVSRPVTKVSLFGVYHASSWILRNMKDVTLLNEEVSGEFSDCFLSFNTPR